MSGWPSKPGGAACRRRSHAGREHAPGGRTRRRKNGVRSCRCHLAGAASQQQTATRQSELYGHSAAQKKQLLEVFDARWALLGSEAGLPGLELDDMADWLARRVEVLQPRSRTPTRRLRLRLKFRLRKMQALP